MGNTVYGDITPRTAAYVVKDLLERGLPFLVFEKFGQTKELPTNSTQSIKFRRYFLDTTFSDFGGTFNLNEYLTGDDFDPTNKVLQEGVTPTATELRHLDITATLAQYGDLITITDVIMDTHEDPVLKEATDILGEQSAIIIEKVRFNVLKAGTNVSYANGSARSDVNTGLDLNQQRGITRTLKRNLAKPITKTIRSTASYGTQAIAPSFVAVCHPDMEAELMGISGFVTPENYGSMTPWENELGKLESVRYVSSTIIEPWADAGGTKGTTISTSGSKSDVYPILYFGRDAYGIVPLKGKSALTPMVVNPTPSDSDPLAQRGHVAWKAWQTAVILNDSYMARAEVAITVLS